MNAQNQAGKLLEHASSLVEAARKAGADAADAVVVSARSTSVSVRLGKVEGNESSESDEFSLRVFVGKRIASVAANIGADPKTLVERAVAMAKVSPEDPFEGLADPALLAKNIKDLDQYDDTIIDTERLRLDALEAEEAALAVKGVTNSSGAGASFGMGGMVLVTSGGFAGSYAATRFGRSVSAIAGEGTAMERDYDYTSRLHFSDLLSSAEIGESAGERAVRRLNSRKMRTGPVNVIFDPRVARGIAGHLAAAINGGSVARKTSFLRNSMGEQILAKGIRVTDDPLRIRGSSSRPFDAEGIEGQPLDMVEDGVLQHWSLSGPVARELGLKSNGRGVRSGSTIGCASTNFAIEPGSVSPQDLIASLGDGFYVTEVFGQGVNMITGEYSRGASGFWIEKGKISFPVSEVTIAGNLKDMFKQMIPANDIERHYGVAAPTLLIEGMTLAGN